jgi:hypothetical protein
VSLRRLPEGGHVWGHAVHWDAGGRIRSQRIRVWVSAAEGQVVGGSHGGGGARTMPMVRFATGRGRAQPCGICIGRAWEQWRANDSNSASVTLRKCYVLQRNIRVKLRGNGALGRNRTAVRHVSECMRCTCTPAYYVIQVPRLHGSGATAA